tara:strand:- start:31 stop:216 length:186 start_codon:yes stop_codon:yes gene_type:complete
MIKEFEINDILNAVDNISKIDRNKGKKAEKKDVDDKENTLILNKPAKSNKSEVLVLNQMIE